MPLQVVCLKLTQEEIEALDALTGFLSLRSRAETIRAGLKALKPAFARNPFHSSLVKSSRDSHGHRPARKKRKATN